MRKKAELLQKIEAKRKAVLAMLNDGKTAEAKAGSDELEKMMADYENMPDDAVNTNVGGEKTMKKDMTAVSKAVNAYLRGQKDESGLLKPVNATATPGQVETVGNRGGVLVPVETADFTMRMATGVYRLRDRVFPFSAKSLSGKIPKVDNPTSGLVALFDELPSGGMSEGQVTFGSVDYTVKDYGLIVPVSNDLLKDANQDVFGIITDQFARAQVITENALILAAIDGANANPTSITGWKGLEEAVNGTDPVGSPDKVIITNTDGWNWLDTLTDDDGHPILTFALVDNPKRIFRGREVIQMPNAVLPTASGAIPFYVGSLYDGVVFIEREGLEIFVNPYSDSASRRNAVDVRVTCRLDCKTKFASAMKKVTYTPST